MPDQMSQRPATPRFLLFEYSEINPDLRADPHARFDPQRAERPIERDGMIPALLLSAYGVGREALMDRTLSRNFDDASPDNIVIANVKRINAAMAAEFGPHESMLTLDDPDHARVRGIVAEAFLKRAAASQGLVARVIDERLDSLAGRDTFDAVNEYAAQIPIRVLGAILGSPPEMYDDLKTWTEAGQLAFDPTKSAEQEATALAGRAWNPRPFQGADGSAPRRTRRRPGQRPAGCPETRAPRSTTTKSCSTCSPCWWPAT
ncbi:MAG: hypothetical protein WDN06_17770 [Asticcacaulis sp.]